MRAHPISTAVENRLHLIQHAVTLQNGLRASRRFSRFPEIRSHAAITVRLLKRQINGSVNFRRLLLKMIEEFLIGSWQVAVVVHLFFVVDMM